MTDTNNNDSFNQELRAYADQEHLSDIGLARIRLSVSRAWDHGTLRWAWGMTGLAASALIAASVWVVMLNHRTEVESANAYSTPMGWERVARTGGGSLERLAGATVTDQQDVRFASMVINGLGSSDRSTQ